MKALLGSLILICLNLSVFAQEAEKQVVQDVIQTAYVDGIHNRQGIDLVKSVSIRDLKCLENEMICSPSFQSIPGSNPLNMRCKHMKSLVIP